MISSQTFENWSRRKSSFAESESRFSEQHVQCTFSVHLLKETRHFITRTSFDSYISSLLNLSWEANQSLLCKFTFCRFFPEPKNCGRPEQPPNSTMIAENFNVGSAVEYSCDEGHLLVGPPSRVCLPTGFYNEFPPVCKRKSFALCKKTKRQTPLILSLATISTCK